MKIAAHIAVNNAAHSEETNGHKTLGKHLPDQNSNLSYAGTYTSAQVLEDLSSHTMTQPVSNVVFRRTTNPMYPINEPSTNNKVRIFTTQEQTHNRGRQPISAYTSIHSGPERPRRYSIPIPNPGITACAWVYMLYRCGYFTGHGDIHLGVVFIKPHHSPLGSIFRAQSCKIEK